MKTNSSKEEYELMANISHLNRVTMPIDIARIALFLASENQIMNGQILTY